MDEFAQTRGSDDLFDDDFTPIAESPHQNVKHDIGSPQNRGDVAATPRRGNRNQDSQTRQQKHKATPQKIDAPSDSQEDQSAGQDATPHGDFEPCANPQLENSQPQFRPTTAFRGDRTATGGTPKPKLTEEELTARLEAAKLNNAKRAEAHRIAEADEASFQQREAHASQRRKEEGQARRVMNMEREKNRLRKLGAQAGREWDEGKEEVDTRGDRGSQYRRGAHGGVAYEGGRGARGRAFIDSRNGYHDGDDPQEFQGRRGGFRGRGRGRGDRGRGSDRGRGGINASKSSTQLPPDPVADFPALPKTTTNAKPNQDRSLGAVFSPATGESWADEVQALKGADEG